MNNKKQTIEELKKEVHKEFDERKWQHWHTRCSQFVEIPDSLKDQLKSFIDSLIDKTVRMTEERIVGLIEERQKLFNFLPKDKWCYKMVKTTDLDIISLITNKSEINKDKGINI